MPDASLCPRRFPSPFCKRTRRKQDEHSFDVKPRDLPRTGKSTWQLPTSCGERCDALALAVGRFLRYLPALRRPAAAGSASARRSLALPVAGRRQPSGRQNEPLPLEQNGDTGAPGDSAAPTCGRRLATPPAPTSHL